MYVQVCIYVHVLYNMYVCIYVFIYTCSMQQGVSPPSEKLSMDASTRTHISRGSRERERVREREWDLYAVCGIHIERCTMYEHSTSYYMYICTYLVLVRCRLDILSFYLCIYIYIYIYIYMGKPDRLK